MDAIPEPLPLSEQLRRRLAQTPGDIPTQRRLRRPLATTPCEIPTQGSSEAYSSYMTERFSR